MVNKLQKVKLLWDDAYNKTLSWFFSYPDKEMTLNSIVSNLSISKTTANRIIRRLEKEGFLEIKPFGKTWRISQNQKHHYNFSRKIAFNLMLLYESGIISLIQQKFPNSKAIVLFGSYRKGDDTGESDIDIAVEISGNQESRVEELGIFSDFGYRKDVKVNLFVFSRNMVDLNLFSNIANGIVLDGFLEVKP